MLTEKARKVFSNDHYATTLTGIAIERVEPDCTTCSLLLEPRHRNAKNAVMGGVFFTLADFTFAIAANTDILAESQTDNVTLLWVSVSSDIHFITQPHGNRLTACSSCIKKGKQQAVYQITITDDENRLIAISTTTGAKIQN